LERAIGGNYIGTGKAKGRGQRAKMAADYAGSLTECGRGRRKAEGRDGC